MASAGVTASTFLDIHNEAELTEEEYLTEDLIRNWKAAWKNNQVYPTKFVDNSASCQARKRLWYNGWVTICGYPGDGKSSIVDNLVGYFERAPWKFPNITDAQTARMAREEFMKFAIDDENRDSYKPVHVSSPNEYKEKVDPNLRQIVIIDDIFGEGVMEWDKIEGWRPYLEDMMWDVTTRRPNTLLVVCVNRAHLERAPSDVTQLEYFKPSTMINLHTSHQLTDEEIMKMTKITQQEIGLLRGLNNLESYPLLYRMRNLVVKFEMAGKDFFKNPWERCLTEIDQIYRVDRILYYTLAVAIMLDGKLDLGSHLITEYGGRTRQIMEQLINILDVPLDVTQSKMRFAAKLLSGFFLAPVGKWQWEITHPRVFSLCLTSLMNFKSKSIIEMLSVDVMCKYIRTVQDGQDFSKELVVICGRDDFDTVAQRLVLGIDSGHMWQLVSNDCFRDERFVSVFSKLVKETGCLGQVVFQKDNEYGRSFFYWACHYGHGHLVKALLSETEELNIKSDARFGKEFTWGYLAACACLAKTSHIVLKSLHEIVGFDVQTSHSDKEHRVAQILGSDFNYLLSMEATPLHIACQKGHHNTVKYLIEQGADIELPTTDGTRVIHRAAGRRDKEGSEVVHTLIRNKVNIEAKTTRLFTALDEAVESGNVNNVRYLVTAGADIHKLQGDHGSSYLAKAIQRQDIGLVDFMMAKNADLNGSRGQDMFPPLTLAVQTGDKSLVSTLLRRGIDIDRPGCNGWSPLHVACYLGYKGIVQQLVDYGANINYSNIDGNTPLHIAAEKGAFDVCELLLEKGALTESMNKKKETPVVCAARGNHAMVTWLLLRDGMELEGKGPDIGFALFQKYLLDK